MIVRLRSKVGTWRLEVQEKTSLSEVMARIEHEHGVKVATQQLSYPDAKTLVSDRPTRSVGELGMKHGAMMYLAFSGELVPAPTGAGAKKSIDSQGNLVASTKGDDGSFRPGLTSLRAQKLHWTLTDMVELDSQYTFNIKAEKRRFCHRASLDHGSCGSFQQYLRNFAFQTSRIGYLYGSYEDVEVMDAELEGGAQAGAAAAEAKANAAAEARKEQKYGATKRKMKLSDLPGPVPDPTMGAHVDAIYEPAQQATASGGVELLEDPREATAEAVAKAMGLQRVGCILAHPPRANCIISTEEVRTAALCCLEANDGKMESPFVVVLVTADEKGQADFQAYQLTPQCLEMVAEDALVPMVDRPGFSAVHETFTAVVEAKAAPVIDNDFFIKRVPIVSHGSPIIHQNTPFPRFNRDADVPPIQATFQAAVKKAGRNPSDEKLCKAIADFHLLMFMGDSLFEVGQGLEQIAACVASSVYPERAPIPLEEGYKIMLCSVAGLD